MAKKILGEDGLWYRWRRGKMVKIPEEWQGVITTKQTIRKRKTNARSRHRNKGRKRGIAQRQSLSLID